MVILTVGGTSMKKCSFCAEEIQNEAVKCKHCGSVLSVETNDGIPSYHEPKFLPRKLLLQNERIYLEVRPYCVSQFSLTILLIIISLFFPLVWFSVPVVYLFQLGEWKNTVYAITTKRVLQIKGLIGKEVKQCGLDRVQNCELKVNWYATHIGTLSFDTSGTSFKEIVWTFVPTPRDIYNQISEILHR